MKAQKGVRPDWAGIIRSKLYEQGGRGTRKSYVNVLPGDSKLSTKWNTSMAREDAEFKKPLFQICHYCDLAGVRYGHLLTQKELVVVRLSCKKNGQGGDATVSPPRSARKWKEQAKISLPKKERTKEHRILEYKSIPWEIGIEQEDNVLSINSTLWWLHMLAARARSISSGYRDLREEYCQDQSPPPSNNHSFSNGRKRGRDHDSESGDGTDRMGPNRKIPRSFTTSFTRSFSMPIHAD